MEDKLNLESLDLLVQGFPKLEDPSTDITKKDPLLLKAVTGTEIDYVLYVAPYSSPPFIMKPTVMVPKPLCVHIFYRDTAKDPTYWSKVCLYNMVKLAREATTLRRVLEPLFHYFDTENQWSSEKGVAAHVLMYLESLLAESGNPALFSDTIFLKNICFLLFQYIDYLFLHTRR